MRHGLWAAATLATAGVLTAGCNNGTEAAIDFPDLTTRIGASYCNYATRCGSTAVFEQFLLHSSLTNCASQTATYFANTTFAQYQEAIDRGTLVYHADRAATCLAAFDGLSCEGGSLSGPPPGCAETFEGTVADGGACTIGEECRPTSRCTGASGATCGMCTHTPQLGEACPANECAQGAFCRSGTCVAQIAAGGACDAMVASSCAGGLSCTSGTCVARMPAGMGEPCALAGCQPGLVCAASGTAITCRAPRADGSCQRVLSGSDCPSGTTCNATGGADGTCVAYPVLGAACTGVCAAPARCVNMVCQPSGELGVACTGNDECLTGLCDAGVCAPRPLCGP